MRLPLERSAGLLPNDFAVAAQTWPSKSLPSPSGPSLSCQTLARHQTKLLPLDIRRSIVMGDVRSIFRRLFSAGRGVELGQALPSGSRIQGRGHSR